MADKSHIEEFGVAISHNLDGKLNPFSIKFAV